MAAAKPRMFAWVPLLHRKQYSTAQVDALKALWAGEATPHQQRMALEWIIYIASGYGDEPFRSDTDGGERETSYALGRQYVGRQIIKLLGFEGKAMSLLRKDENAGPRS
jgi:hypothetical protein